MSLVDLTVDVAPDEHVAAAGYRIAGVAESLYPPNVLIGQSRGCWTRTRPSRSSSRFGPAVDFSSLSLVLVVLSRPDERG